MVNETRRNAVLCETLGGYRPVRSTAGPGCKRRCQVSVAFRGIGDLGATRATGDVWDLFLR